MKQGVSLDFGANFKVMDDIAGTVEGIEGAFYNRYYLDNLAHAAHDSVSEEFDTAAASAAGAGYLSHMYEFGVAGITRGPVRIADPTSAAARLWTHGMTGSDGFYDIEFDFRPAVVPNPQPTTKETGVPSSVLRRLSRRRYLFYNKAMVTEMGMEVEIASKQPHGMLFVPFGAGNKKNGKSYMMWHYPSRGPIFATPGRRVSGQFTSFWESWWGTLGKKLMDQYIERVVNSDVAAAFAASEARAATEVIKPVGASVQDTSRLAAQKTESVMIKKSKARKGRRRK